MNNVTRKTHCILLIRKRFVFPELEATICLTTSRTGFTEHKLWADAGLAVLFVVAFIILLQLTNHGSANWDSFLSFGGYGVRDTTKTGIGSAF